MPGNYLGCVSVKFFSALAMLFSSVTLNTEVSVVSVDIEVILLGIKGVGWKFVHTRLDIFS